MHPPTGTCQAARAGGVRYVSQVAHLQAEKWSEAKLSTIERKAALENRAEELRAKMRDSQLHNFRAEARHRCASAYWPAKDPEA